MISVLESRCRAKPKSVALPESNDERVLAAAIRLADSGCVHRVVLFDTRATIQSICSSHQLNFGTLEKVAIFAHENFARLAEQATEHLRASHAAKGRTVSAAELASQADNRLLLAGELLHQGEVSAVVAGAVATTAAVIRAAISSVGLAEGCRTVSGAFILFKEHPRPGEPAVMMFADAGVVIAPTEQQLVDIASATAQTWNRILEHDWGPPRVAFLSFSTKGSAEHPSATKMSAANAAFRLRHPDISSDGELQFDAAIVPDVARRKCSDSPIAGAANCFVFPDLGAGNIAYKITQRLGGYAAFGPILQGLNRPFSDLSRGASVEDIYVSCLINMLRQTGH